MVDYRLPGMLTDPRLLDGPEAPPGYYNPGALADPRQAVRTIPGPLASSAAWLPDPVAPPNWNTPNMLVNRGAAPAPPGYYNPGMLAAPAQARPVLPGPRADAAAWGPTRALPAPARAAIAERGDSSVKRLLGAARDKFTELAPYMMSGMGGGRRYGAPATPAAVAATKAAASTASASAAQSTKAAAAEQDPFDKLIGVVAKSQGGKISLAQMAALADIVGKTSPSRARPPSGRDQATMEGMSIAQQMYEKQKAQAIAAGNEQGLVDAAMQYSQRINLLAGVGASDQLTIDQYLENQRD